VARAGSMARKILKQAKSTILSLKRIAIIPLVMLITSIYVFLLTPSETMLFYDGFEYYLPGSYPFPAWEFWFNYNGEVVNTTSVSPSSCLRLLGSFGWATEAIRKFSSDSVLIGYEVYVRVEKIAPPNTAAAAVGFMRRVSKVTSLWYASVWFHEGGKIISGKRLLGTYVANRWYKVKVLFDRNKKTYDVWIDDVLVGSSITDPNIDPYAIEGFTLSSEWAEVNCYFDDVKVFSRIPLEELFLRWITYTGSILGIIEALRHVIKKNE
jgi:hypothetical protein